MASWALTILKIDEELKTQSNGERSFGKCNKFVQSKSMTLAEILIGVSDIYSSKIKGIIIFNIKTCKQQLKQL